MFAEILLGLVATILVGLQLYRLVWEPLMLTPEELEAIANYYEELYPSTPIRINLMKFRSQRRAAELFAPYDPLFLPESPVFGDVRGGSWSRSV